MLKGTISFAVVLVLCAGLYAQGNPENSSVAASGDPVWVILNHVKADKRPQFEKFVYEVLVPALEKNAEGDPTSRNILEHTRMLEPRRANKDSSYTYIWLMDPVVKEANYSYGSIISGVHSAEETEKYLSMVGECLVVPQVFYSVKQGRW
ncbi:MAG: hypothetical protein VYA69_13835 [Gemmatimonadota bacterium]|nr:hypothetical protein [Gemmatimonadota bacterium]